MVVGGGTVCGGAEWLRGDPNLHQEGLNSCQEGQRRAYRGQEAPKKRRETGTVSTSGLAELLRIGALFLLSFLRFLCRPASRPAQPGLS